MPSYKSNAREVLGNLRKRLTGLRFNVLEPAARAIAADVAASNTYRIHNQGLAVDGSGIGDYKNGKYKQKRIEASKRVDKVDLSFSGKLSKEFTFAAISPGEIGVGFLTPYGSNLSENLEEKYGKKIWGVTQEDEREAEEFVRNKINQYMNG